MQTWSTGFGRRLWRHARRNMPGQQGAQIRMRKQESRHLPFDTPVLAPLDVVSPQRQALLQPAVSSKERPRSSRWNSVRDALSPAASYQSYTYHLRTAPIITKSLTCFFGAAIGDGVAQLLSGAAFDLTRNVRFAVFGLAFSGPTGHWWHQFLDAKIMPQHPTCTAAVFLKLFFDQLAFAPMASLMCLSFLKVAEGDIEQVVPYVKDKLWGVVKANWMLWPAANWIAFRFLKADWRILYANIIGLAWCTFLSWIANADKSSKEA